MFKKIMGGFLLSILLVSLAGCGSTKKADMSAVSNSMPVEAKAAQNQSAGAQVEFSRDVTSSVNGSGSKASNDKQDSANNIQAPVAGGYKVIQTGTVSIETLKFEDTVSNLTNYINSIGGYIEGSNVKDNRINNSQTNSSRNAQFIFRIPQVKYSQLFTDVKTFGTVVSEQSKGEDITDKYFDTEARLKSLQIQEERLLSLLQKAGKMEDILTIEKELQNTRYQIENYTGTVRKWDSLVSFSTVTINIAEVQEIKPIAPNSRNGLFNRMNFGFTNSLIHAWNLMQDLLVFVVASLPFFVPIIITFFVVFHLYKRRKKKDKDTQI